MFRDVPLNSFMTIREGDSTFTVTTPKTFSFPGSGTPTHKH